MLSQLVNLMENLPENMDGAIITSPYNRRYLTNMISSAGTLIITKKSPYFIIDFRYIDKAKTIITDFPVILQKTDIHGQIGEIFKKDKVVNVCFEANKITVSQYNKYCRYFPSYNFSIKDDLSKKIDDLRAVKSQEEIGYMEQAQDITDRTFMHILDFIKVGMTEREIAIEIEYNFKKLGASGIAFDSIVVSGVNSSLPHGVPTDKKIQDGDFLTMDIGAEFNGYCSDMTRTIAIGNVSDEQKRVYDTVLKAQLMAIDSIKLGKKHNEIDKVARDYIYANGYEGCFGHGLGHSLGLEVHEEPRLSSTCDIELIENSILTVEPGIYLTGKFGVRIEDMVIVTKKGAINMTKSEKNLIIL